MKRLDLFSIAEIVEKFDTFIFDCDGVIYRGEELTPRAREALLVLAERGKRVCFCTNNATASRAGYLAKFARHGIEEHIEQIFTSGSASAAYIKKILPSLPEGRRGIYLIGQKGLEDELEAQGLEWAGGTDPVDDEHMPFQDFSGIEPDPSIGIVLCSFDMHVNYKKYCKAFNYLAMNPWCRLILTNADVGVITEDGRSACPGEGAIAAPLLLARPGLAATVVGKPQQILMDDIRDSTGFDPARTVMIGDTLATDIEFGRNAGVATILVMTGSTTERALAATEASRLPDYVLDHIGQFADALQMPN